MDIGGLPGVSGFERLVSAGCDRGRSRHRFCPRTRRWSGLSESYRLRLKRAASRTTLPLCSEEITFMPFDIDKLFVDCCSKIEQFAQEHSDETFYAFAIDASMLCFNSIEQFSQTLKKYQSRWDYETRPIKSLAEMTEEDWLYNEFALNLAEKYSGLDRSDEKKVLEVINKRRIRERAKGCKYLTEESIHILRENTGDWAYQGFADLDNGNGFNSQFYNEHYYEAMDSEDGHAPNTAYAIAMSSLIERLQHSDVFRVLKLTDDFTISWVEHSY